jgi:carnitine O-acetyltransferase
LLFAAAQFRKLVVAGKLPTERVGKEKTPLDATAYKYMFNACRIPRRDHDGYRIYDPSRYTHAIVARKGHFFAIEMVHAGSGEPLPVTDLEEQLRQCLILADSIPSSRPQLGIMTTNNRDEWADARDSLLRMGGLAMEEALEKLESGALLLNLDDEVPVSRQELGDLYWTGGLKSGPNRWFDKSIQIMVASNGKAGLCAEHSMMDGMPVINFSDFITKMTYSKARTQSARLPSGAIVVEDIFGEALSQISQPSVVEALGSNGKTILREGLTANVTTTSRSSISTLFS